MRKEIFIAILIGAAAGMLAGISGVGGGVFLVPLMVGVLGLAQHHAHGTSLAVIVLIAIAGAITYGLYGHITMNWTLILVLAAGSVVGVVFGARLMMRVPARQLRLAFAAFLVLLGIYMVVTPGA